MIFYTGRKTLFNHFFTEEIEYRLFCFSISKNQAVKTTFENLVFNSYLIKTRLKYCILTIKYHVKIST